MDSMSLIIVAAFVGLVSIAAIIDKITIKKRETDAKRFPSTTNYVSSKSGHVTVSIPYDGDRRYINGKPISTPDDLTEWWVIKGFSEAIGAHLSALENDMLDGNCTNYTDTKEQWNMYYARLRELCIRHKLWNPALNDRQIFVPTNTQLALEKQLFQWIEAACESGISESFQYAEKSKEILDYIHAQPGHAAVRKQMVSKLAENDPDIKDEYRKVCRRMVRDSVLTETHDEKGRLLLKKKRTHRKKAEELVDLPPSNFSHSLYQNIDYQTLCKVKHTVGAPISLDLGGNRCEFQSLSSGEIYKTSLERCTCPAFENGHNPCKHMVAFAKHLGYL